jgi:hypothetical protein
MQETWFVFPNPTKVLLIVVVKIFWVNTMIKKLILQEVNGIDKWKLHHWKNFRKCFGTVVEFNVHFTALHINATFLFPARHFLAMCSMFPTPTNLHIKIFMEPPPYRLPISGHIYCGRELSTQHAFLVQVIIMLPCDQLSSITGRMFPPPPNLQNIFSSPSKCVRFISMGPLMLLNTSFKNCHFSSACIYHKFKGHIKSNQHVHIILQQRYM